MGNVLTIFRRELSAYFTSPIAYIFVLVFLIFSSALFFVFFSYFQSQDPSLRPYFLIFLGTYLLLIPPISMRLWSEEKKSGSIELLMTLPFRSVEVVIGKYLGAFCVILFTLLLTLAVPLSVSTVVSGLDWGVIFTSYFGAVLLAAVYLAVGACASAFTQNQIVAMLVSFVFLAILAILGAPWAVQALRPVIGELADTLAWFGFYEHYETFARGVINPVDVVYAFSLTAFFLILNNFAVEQRKY